MVFYCLGQCLHGPVFARAESETFRVSVAVFQEWMEQLWCQSSYAVVNCCVSLCEKTDDTIVDNDCASCRPFYHFDGTARVRRIYCSKCNGHQPKDSTSLKSFSGSPSSASFARSPHDQFLKEPAGHCCNPPEFDSSNGKHHIATIPRFV